jgi:hypothetical protein
VSARTIGSGVSQRAEQRRPPTPAISTAAIVVVGLLLVAATVSGSVLVIAETTYDLWAGLVIGPAIVAVSLPIFAREANRADDPRLFWFLTAALVAHLVLAFVGRIVAYDVYDGRADVGRYHAAGVEFAERFRQADFTIDMPGGIVGTNFPGLAAGVVYAVVGATSVGGFLVFSWLGFWGCFFFYRAFRLAVPEGRLVTYRRLLFLLPSLAFWSSFMGKDSWMVFGMGVATFGVAQVLTGHALRGIVPGVIGSACMLVVRPHIAGMMGIAFASAFLFMKPRRELRELAPVAKGLLLVVVASLAAVLLVQTERFLQEEGIDTDKGLSGVLDETSEGASYGGSEFEPAIVRGPQDLPLATFTVLFRPLPNEASSGLERLASLEAMFLLLLTIWRWKWIVAALRSVRRQPFVMFCIAYTGMAIIAFSAFANFGLLDRERVQILPLFLVLLCVPARTARSENPAHGSDLDATQDRARHHG